MATGKLKTIGLLEIDNIDLNQWEALENREINHFDITGQVEKSPGEMVTLKFRVNFASCDRNDYLQQRDNVSPIDQMSKNLCVFCLNKKMKNIWFLLASVGVNNPKLAMIMHVPGMNFTAYSIETEKQFSEEYTDGINPDMIEAMLKKINGRSRYEA